jgi:hypothetical protein
MQPPLVSPLKKVRLRLRGLEQFGASDDLDAFLHIIDTTRFKCGVPEKRQAATAPDCDGHQATIEDLDSSVASLINEAYGDCEAGSSGSSAVQLSDKEMQLMQLSYEEKCEMFEHCMSDHAALDVKQNYYLMATELASN